MKIPNYLKDPVHPITVNVIGVGGTGSLVVPRLARMDYGLKLLGHPGLMVFAYDDDKVEQFNVGRQNFTDTDLGKNKALCWIEKCNVGYGLLWKAFPKKFNTKTDTFANINMLCVDSAKFRKTFYDCERQQLVKYNHPYEEVLFNIDGGNGKDFGQVIISTPKKDTGLKNPFALFPDMAMQDNSETQGIESCSYEDSLAKQDFFINDEISVGMMKLMWKLFREDNLKFNGIIVNQEKCKQLPILASDLNIVPELQESK